jgi:transcriptional regulator with XRE-family HTH domain
MAKTPREDLRFGEQLRRARLEGGWSQFEFSLESKIPQADLSNYENGRYEPNLVTYIKISRVLGWPIPDWWKATGTDDGLSNRWNTHTPSDLQLLWPQGFGREVETLSAVR